MKARFITLEGIDGAGKSSHVDAMAAWLRRQNGEVVTTREPGGTPLAESLRDMVLHAGMDALTETLLVFAARRDHLQQCIEPALQRGAMVLCDRFTDASFAYQGGGRGVNLAWLAQLENWVHAGRQPDLTFWFDLAPAIAAARRAAARTADRFEQQDEAFFARVRKAYEARCNAAPERFVRLDAEQPPAVVWSQIVQALEARACQ